MTPSTRALLRWSPRLLGLAVALFFSVFAFGMLGGGHAAHGMALRVLMHLLPALLVLVAVVVGWRVPWAGAVGFLGLAGVYAATTRRPDWILVIAGPLALVGILFALSWRYGGETRAGA